MPTTIAAERPDTRDAQALIQELDAHLTPLYPSESRHGYSVDKLLRDAVAFFVMRHDGAPAGCGGVQLFGADYGEVKRMYVRPAFRGLGLGQLMLDRLAGHVRSHGVSLPPFGDYKEDPLSRFYEMRIA
jgi:GNAT superfamily N-acetyltransferase